MKLFQVVRSVLGDSTVGYEIFPSTK